MKWFKNHNAEKLEKRLNQIEDKIWMLQNPATHKIGDNVKYCRNVDAAHLSFSDNGLIIDVVFKRYNGFGFVDEHWMYEIFDADNNKKYVMGGHYIKQ